MFEESNVGIGVVLPIHCCIECWWLSSPLPVVHGGGGGIEREPALVPLAQLEKKRGLSGFRNRCCGTVELRNCGIVELWSCGIADLWMAYGLADLCECSTHKERTTAYSV